MDGGTFKLTLPVNKPILSKDEIKAVNEVVKSGVLTSAAFDGGKKVQELEKAVCEFTGAKYAVAVNSGTAALQAALMAYDIGPGDEVAVPSFTFVATANAVRAVGAEPVFIDIEPIDFTMSADDLQRKITNNTKAIIPVHIYGHSCEMDVIKDIGNYFEIPVIEDACQSLGTIYKNKHTGTIGAVGCYSFYPGKVITTGEGGIAVTDSKIIADKMRMIRNHGMIKGYDSEILGLNLRMTEVSAAIGVEQMKKLELFIRRRRENALYLTQKLDDIISKHDDDFMVYPIEDKNEARNQILYTIMVKKPKRNKIVKALNAEGIGATVYYPTPVHKLPLYNDPNVFLPVTEEMVDLVFSVPVHPNVTKKDLNKIAKIIGENFA